VCVGFVGKFFPHETRYSTLQHTESTATHYNRPSRKRPRRLSYATHCNTLQHTATEPCNTPQHTAAHCNRAMQHTATHCNTLQQSHATHRNTLQHSATEPCNTPQHTAAHWNRAMQHTATHHATHCNTLQHTATPSTFLPLGGRECAAGQYLQNQQRSEFPVPKRC